MSKYSHKNLSALEYSLSKTKELADICAPLRKHLNITYFANTRLYSNGKLLHLTTNENWTKMFSEKELFNESDRLHDVRRNTLLNNTTSIILSGSPKGERCKALFDQDIWHICAFYQRHADYIEGWTFGTKKENTRILELYLNQRQLLQHFIFYFKDKTSKLLGSCPIDDKQLIITKLATDSALIEDNVIENFIELLNINNFNIYHEKRDIKLSKKDIIFLEELSQGYSIKEIGYKFDLSPRTIEAYINNIRLKSNLKSKSALIQMYRKAFGAY